MSSVSWQNALTICLILAILLTMFALSTSTLAAEDGSALLGGTRSVSVDYNENPPWLLSIDSLPVTANPARTATSSDLGVFASSYLTERFLVLVFASASEGCSVTLVNVGSPSVTNIYALDEFDQTTSLWCRTLSVSTSALGVNQNNELFSCFPDRSSCFTALREAISSNSSSTSMLFYSLPPGNVAYITVQASTYFSLACSMPESVLGSNHFPGNNQVVTLVSSIPSSGRAPSAPLIPWQQNGALSILGLSRAASYESTTASSGYLCIVNPLYYSGTANGPYEFLSNGSIDIIVQSASGIIVRPLDSTLGFTSGLGVDVTTDILPESYTGVVDSETGEITWTDPSGGETAPSAGGGNLVSTGETIFDFLRNIADEIATFLRGPINAVKTVVSALRDFMSSFVELYQWLPAPVYNLITAGLMIAVTIGVIKIFV